MNVTRKQAQARIDEDRHRRRTERQEARDHQARAFEAQQADMAAWPAREAEDRRAAARVRRSERAAARREEAKRLQPLVDAAVAKALKDLKP